MTISYHWLCQYLPQEIDPESLSNILTGIGLEVEEMSLQEAVKGSLKGLVVGEVCTCEPHPNADRLRLTTVRVSESEDPLQIVCGAPNVAKGQKVIVATIGTELFSEDGHSFKIKKSKLRGALSEGMICAEDEIGMGQSHDGILVLPEDTPIGLSAADYFKLPESETIITIGLTPNRSDANSHLGVAKDLCAYWSYQQEKLISPLLPKVQNKLSDVHPENPLPIEVLIENTEACWRYAGVILKNIKVGPSPEWLQNRLKAIGIHPINNLVDITNFVLNEFGQPLHAFDYDKIEGHQIRVKNLSENTPFVTLDGQKQALSAEDLMICDGQSKPMCLAGIYGGLDSGISEETTTVFIESAYFHPKTIRRSSLRHGLRTDAATHFEKGVAMDQVIPALQRATDLIIEIAGGVLSSPLIDHFPHQPEERLIEMDYAYLEKICGKAFPASKVEILFKTLGFQIKANSSEGITVGIPGENQDLYQNADLAEEVLRMDGLDQVAIPSTLSYTIQHHGNLLSFRAFKERLATYLANAGLNEIITNSITNSQYYPEEKGLVTLLNSLSSELDILRPSMLESGLEVIGYNLNRKQDQLHLFELGKTYHQKGETVYVQKEFLSLWSTGAIRPNHWLQKAQMTNGFFLKGLIQALFSFVGLEKFQEETREDGQYQWRRGKQIFATLTQVGAEKTKQFGIKQAVYYAEIAVNELYEAVKNLKIKYKAVPKFPSMKRDLAIVVPKSTKYSALKEVVHKKKWEALKHFEVFDIFEHEKLGASNKSVAMSFTFQLEDRTMTDKEVDQMMTQLTRDLEQKLQAEIRG